MIRKFCTLILILFPCAMAGLEQVPVHIKVNYIANGAPLQFRDSSYTNAFGESYTVSRLKFYMGNTSLKNATQYSPPENILVDAADDKEQVLSIAPGRYDTLEFLLGVDSALNNSGAQDGVLDPLNGMFWTWNSGYIFFKMEGYSSSSTADLNRIEHHIGGYEGPYNAIRKISLPIPGGIEVKATQEKSINLELNLDHYWKDIQEIKIADAALIMSPGPKAAKAADNFRSMFSIISQVGK